MEITEIQLRRMDTGNKMKALAAVIFDDSFIIHDIRVIENEDRMLVVMPSRKYPDGSFGDIAHPLNSDMRQRIEQAVLNEYQKK
ncbi:septation regulator SpoVG [Isobaculum melis]|uniref:Stage V sporulation protein G n=1 Tax=Isobaculum melis TaxID=142588 RepID=A0A1H9PSB5_9LACT|nr:septation regulator SpoVG [Isobaculum melis]SER51121.1 stage V sporulation protein G [Isobaculum melis]